MGGTAEQGLTTYTGPQALARAPVDWGQIQRVFARMVSKSEDHHEVIATMIACKELGFNPVLNHVFLIKGAVYVSHKGLLNLAHRSGVFDGIEVLEQTETETHWFAKVAVYRKDMSRPFIYGGRYPKGGDRRQYGPEMAVTRAETMALRRAFDVGLPVKEEIDALEGEYRVGEYVAPAEDAPAQLAAPREKAAPPPLPASPLDATTFREGVDAFLACAEAGYSLTELRQQITDWDPDLDQEQREDIRAHYAAIKEHREQERAARMAPNAVTQQIIEAEVTVAPQPPTAAALAASANPFGDHAAGSQAPVSGEPGGQVATERQVKFIYAIAREAGLDDQELVRWCEELYQCPVAQLNRRDAATLIEALQRRRNEVAGPFDAGQPASIAG